MYFALYLPIQDTQTIYLKFYNFSCGPPRKDKPFTNRQMRKILNINFAGVHDYYEAVLLCKKMGGGGGVFIDDLMTHV